MKLTRELKDFYNFFWDTSSDQKQIIFYAEHSGYYPFFEGMINELIDCFQKKVSYITSDFSDPVLINPKSGIKPFYLNKLLSFFMPLVNSKVFIMTLTDLNQSYLKRSRGLIHYVYVFHALVSAHMMYKRGAFDYYDLILCAGPHHIREIRCYEKLADLKPKKLVEAGYYRLERIYEAYKKYSISNAAMGRKKTILIAPSWGDNNVLEACGEKLVGILLENGYNVIVRPHPEIIKRFPELISRLDSRFGDNPMFALEKSIVSDESLLKADVLICDCSGIALEYALGTERPVLFIDVPVKIKNPKFKELGIEPLELELRGQIGTIVSPANLELIPIEISRLISDRERFRNVLIRLREKYVFNFGVSSKIGAQCIISLL